MLCYFVAQSQKKTDLLLQARFSVCPPYDELYRCAAAFGFQPSDICLGKRRAACPLSVCLFGRTFGGAEKAVFLFYPFKRSAYRRRKYKQEYDI